jgi:hypothetical protein
MHFLRVGIALKREYLHPFNQQLKVALLLPKFTTAHDAQLVYMPCIELSPFRIITRDRLASVGCYEGAQGKIDLNMSIIGLRQLLFLLE